MIIETKMDLEIRENILTSIEEVSGIPREYWEHYRTKKPTEILLRKIYIFMMYQFTDKTKNEIRELVGFKNHASVISSINEIMSWKKNPEKYEKKAKLLNQILENYGQKH